MIATRPDNAEELLRDALNANRDLDGLAAAFKPSLRSRLTPQWLALCQSLSRRQIDQSRSARRCRHVRRQNWFLGGLSCSGWLLAATVFFQSRQRQLINYSIAISRDGHPVGIINADVSLDWLHQILGHLDKPEGAYAFVLDSDGDYLAHDNPALVGKRGTSRAARRAGQRPGRLGAPAGRAEPAGARRRSGSIPSRSKAPVGGSAWWYRKSGSMPACGISSCGACCWACWRCWALPRSRY